MIVPVAWFKFNGVDSRSMGIRVTSMPDTVRAERRIDTVTVAGRNGTLHTDEGVYNSYTRSMECAVRDREHIDEIAAWLAGRGEMIFSTEPDKVYDVFISNKIDISQMMKVFQKFMVTLDCQPFKSSVNAFGDTIELDAPTTIYNKGTVYSEPQITIYGQGAVTLTINEIDYNITTITDYITIDSGLMEVYKDTASQNNVFIAEDFPRFEVGQNTISWTGSVTSIEIVPRWRWL